LGGLDDALARARFTGELRRDEPMSAHTSLGIGGPAKAMAWPATVDELAALYSAAANEGVPVFCLGAGTNLLVLDGGIPGMVINMRRLGWIDLERGEQGVSQVHAGAGLPLQRLVAYCTKAGLSGLEFAAGIPGTVGGAVAMNAGAAGGEVKDVLTAVTLVRRDGAVVRASAADIEMGYRRAALPEGALVAEAAFALLPWPAAEIRALIKKNATRRRASQPTRVKSAGSTFKNPVGQSAWRLIDMAGLRGKKIGRAQVSTRHTNFLINTGGATARDYKALMELVVDKVKERFGVTLEPEIRIVGVDI
jgi:UDP-N-acetylmuramate dehydrogenase